MSIYKKSLWIMVLCGALIAGQGAAAAAEVPTTAELHAMYDAGQYHECLKKIVSLLNLKGEAAKDVEKEKLMLLRAQCNVKIGNASSALKVYKALSEETTDADLALRGRAGALLLENSKTLKYRRSEQDTLDLKTDEGWKEAAHDLFNKKYAAEKDSLEAAMSAQLLEPVAKALDTLADLTALDREGGGDGSTIASDVDKVDQQGRDLIRQELGNMEKETASLEALSEQWIPLQRAVSDRRGLFDPERDRLAEIIKTVEMCYHAALEGEEAAQVLGRNAESWKPIIDQAFSTGQYAQNLLDEN